MKVINVTGVTKIEDKQVETTVKKLAVKFTAAVPAAVFDECNAVDVTGKIQTVRGTKTNINKMSLAALLEIAANNQGSVKVDLTAGTIEGTIEISNDGALNLGTDILLLSFTGMLAGSTLEVSTLDDAQLSNTYIKYEPIHFNKDVAKEIDVTGAYQMAIPEDALEYVELHILTPTGQRTVRYTYDEVKAICDEINEIAYLVKSDVLGDQPAFTVVTGSNKFFSLPIPNVTQAKVAMKLEGNIYLVSNEAL